MLRKRAEERSANQPPFPSACEQAQLPKATRHLLHELFVHQIELEMQNEELRCIQVALETSNSRYHEFYNQAPIGYCSISDKGLVDQANWTIANMLGTLPHKLLGKPFSKFVKPEDQDVLYLFRRKLLDTQLSQRCELRLLQTNGKTLWVNLAAVAVPHDDSRSSLSLALSDITERKQFEEDDLAPVFRTP